MPFSGDPLERMVEVYRLLEGNWLRVATGSEEIDARLEPFEAAAIDLTELWLEPEPPAGAAAP